jgi:hypothetical protein
MPEILGRLRTPRLSAPPASPALGEMYYDTTTNRLLWWNGTAWILSTGAAASLGAAYAQTIGDGTTTAFTITHGLGITDVDVTVQETGGNKSIVYPEVQITGANSITVIFDVAPATNAYRVLVNIPAAGVGSPPALVTSLPGSPVDGQEVYLQIDATNGINWHLRYRAGSASAYKWEFVGGPPLTAQVEAQESTSSGGYTNLTTPGPLFSLPRAGDYIIESGFQAIGGGGGNWSTAIVVYGGVIPTVGDADEYVVSGNSGIEGAGSRLLRKTGLGAVEARMIYRIGGGGTSTFRKRWLSAIPVRVS